MNKIKYLTGRITLVCCGTLLLALLNGCIGVVGPGYGGGAYVNAYVPGPDVVVFGGGGGHDREFSSRGAASRGSFGGGRR